MNFISLDLGVPPASFALCRCRAVRCIFSAFAMLRRKRMCFRQFDLRSRVAAIAHAGSFFYWIVSFVCYARRHIRLLTGFARCARVQDYSAALRDPEWVSRSDKSKTAGI